MKKSFLKNNKRKIIIACIVMAALLSTAVIFMAVCNIIVISGAAEYVLSFEDALEIRDADCIIILGAGVTEDGKLSNVLKERVDAGARLYLGGTSERILVSGDHSRENYNEVGAMKSYLTDNGISPDVIFTDHAGFDTYDTMYRAKDIFQAKKVIIVTQEFHISRAVYIARCLGLEAYGTASDENDRYFNLITEIREFAARTKYVFDGIFKPEPAYLGEAIPIWGEASASDG